MDIEISSTPDLVFLLKHFLDFSNLNPWLDKMELKVNRKFDYIFHLLRQFYHLLNLILQGKTHQLHIIYLLDYPY